MNYNLEKPKINIIFENKDLDLKSIDNIKLIYYNDIINCISNYFDDKLTSIMRYINVIDTTTFEGLELMIKYTKDMEKVFIIKKSINEDCKYYENINNLLDELLLLEEECDKEFIKCITKYYNNILNL
jgi:hypothetical protein